MKFSYKWIQSHIDEPLPAPESLKETIIFHAFEVESVDAHNDDFIFDIKVLPDRAGDCFSHYGMAREVAGLLNLTLKPQEFPVIPDTALGLPIEIKSTDVNRYIAIRMNGVKIAQSPKWLKEALESVGQRSINNVVDATNYVLQDIGQPVHAFDAAKIDGGIIVRNAHDEESMVTLSDETKTLRENMVVIADYMGALAIAGVKGGKSAEVTNETTSIVIEVANFDAVSVRKTSRKLNLITDASKRFENNYSSEFASIAALQIAALIKDIAGGEVVGVSDSYPKRPEARTISFSVSDINRLLGDTVTGRKIATVFDAYKYTYAFSDGVFTCTVPYWRNDIVGVHDIAEEIGRVVGYDTIPTASLPFTPVIEENPVEQQICAVKSALFAQAFREVMNYTFVKKGEVSVAYGPKDKSALRTNLSDALKESYERNKTNAPLLETAEVRLFEIGTVFFADREEIRVGTVVNGTSEELPLAEYVSKHTIDVRTISMPQAKLPIAPFKEWSVYPFITRDIAVWTADAGKKELEDIVQTFASKHCAVPAYMFDSFSKEGKTSVAYRFVFQSMEKTLTDEFVSETFAELTSEIRSKNVFEIR